MHLTGLEANLACLGLVAADLLARTWRLQALVYGVGRRVTLRQSFMINAFAEAGATLSPMRVAGEPARLAGMLACRVPATASFVAIAFEVITAWPVLLLVTAVIGVRWAPDWWHAAGPRLAASARHDWPWALAVVALSLAALVGARHLARSQAHRAGRPLRRLLVYWRRMPAWPLLLSLPLSFVNNASRIALLPVLALTLPEPPSMATLIVGSYALTFGQLLLPTPAGAGAVELGFLGGAAGDLGRDDAWLLLAWRFWANGFGTLIGVWLAARLYGWPALRRGVARLLRRHPPAPGAA